MPDLKPPYEAEPFMQWFQEGQNMRIVIRLQDGQMVTRYLRRELSEQIISHVANMATEEPDGVNLIQVPNPRIHGKS